MYKHFIIIRSKGLLLMCHLFIIYKMKFIYAFVLLQILSLTLSSSVNIAHSREKGRRRGDDVLGKKEISNIVLTCR